MNYTSSLIIENILDRLRGKTAWITGGKRVGQVVARALAERGVNIIVSYRSSREEAEQTVREARARGVEACAVQGDIAHADDVRRIIQEGEKECGPILYLIQMASVFSSIAWDVITEDDWNNNINAHIMGSFIPSQALMRRWSASGKKGKVIFFTDRTSPDAGRVYIDHIPYIVTKGAVHAMVKTLAREWGKSGITVNAIAPGPLLRPSTIPEKEWRAIRKKALLPDVTDEEAVRQVALAVVYWLTAELSTGQTLMLDSGINIQ